MKNNITAEKEDELVGEFMKVLVLLILTHLLFVSCDTPQRNRMPYQSQGNGLMEPTNTSGNPWEVGGSSGGNGGNGGTTSGGQMPPGFENCDLSTKYYASGINSMGICQSTQDETSVLVKSSVTDTVRTCLIPTYKDQSGSSTYLGQPQCYIPQANTVSSGRLYKTRNGFSNYTINGVMVMKEPSLTAYFTCMDAYITFTHPSCPYGARTNPTCEQMARSYMDTKCNYFKANHSYIDILLRNSI